MPFNSTHYVVLYPQNGDPVATIDSVTTLHPSIDITRNRKYLELIQKLQFIHSVNGDGSKTAKIIVKVILLSITLIFKQCDGG